MSFNKVILVANLTKDPEVKHTSSTTICNFSVAVNRKYKSGDEQKEEVSYFDIVVFGKQADVCLQYLSKGRQVLVDGRLQQQRWEDKESGQKRSKIVVVAENVRFLGKKSDDPDNEYSAPRDYQAPPQPPLADGDVPF